MIGRLKPNVTATQAVSDAKHVAEETIGLVVFTGLLCGLVPAFAAARTSMNETLKKGGRTGSSGTGNARSRSGLVVVQIAVAMVLLAAAGLLLRSFEKMRNVDLGFRPDHTLVASYSLPQKQYATQTSVDRFNGELLRRLQQSPGVRSVGLTSFLPASGNNSNSGFFAEGSIVPNGSLNLATTVQVEGTTSRPWAFGCCAHACLRLTTELERKL